MISPNEPSGIETTLETLARRDPGGRGLAGHAPTGSLLTAARELERGERVLIVTGFCIRPAMIGETDGPPGALSLATALLGLGRSVRILTDDFSASLLSAGSAAAGTHFPVDRIGLPQADADRAIDALVAEFAPTHVVAIERPGDAVDGHRYSMRGEALDDLIPSADRLFDPPGARGYTTVAIGDGGNELGMGALRDLLMERVELGDKIFSTAAADYVVPAGISNWGGYALAAAMSVVSGRMLILPSAHERVVLEAMVAAGAVDGCTRRRELSVDGLGWNDYARTLDDIYAATVDCLSLSGAAVDLPDRIA